MNHSIDKGPTLLLLLLVAFAISGVGVALDGKVIPPASDTQSLIDDSAAQSVLSRRKAETASPTEPSNVTRQLRRAVDAANRSDVESAGRLQARVAASDAKMEELNVLLEEKRGSVGLTAAGSERTKQFDRQLGELNERLEKPRPSN